MVNRKMPRVHDILLPHLKNEFPDVMFTSWVPHTSQREYPLVNIRRLGGLPVNVSRLDMPVVELTTYGDVDLGTTENLFYDVRQCLFDMVDQQIVTPAGYLHSYFETMGPTQFDSPYEDTWRVQGLIQLGVRPPR